MEKLIIFTDGGARGNPGPAAIGVVFIQNDKEIFSHGEKIGNATNNVAEYKAIIFALSKAKEEFARHEIRVNLDSELVCRQLNGQYKVRDENLKKLFYEVRERVIELGGKVEFYHIRREQNKKADCLVNRALDE